MSRNTLLTYPDFNETFKIRTNAINFQLEDFIRQKGKPIYLYSRNITESQRRYTVIETELISIVETLKWFRTILLGQRLITYNDN